MHVQILSRLTPAAGHVRQKLRRSRAYLTPVAIMTAVYALGISAILRANFNYIDDMYRVYKGYQGWADAFSRYLSNFLSNFIHADSYLTDVSPLPQLLACLLLGVSSVIVLHVITGRDRFSFWEYAAVLPLGLSPYMLACLSFKYDAPYMAVSVLASVAPLLAAAERPHGWAFGVCCFLGTLAMCLTYQAASGILPMFVVLLTVKKWQEGERLSSAAAFAAVAAAGYCAAIIFFKVLLVHPTEYGYVDAAILPLGQLLPHAVEVLRDFFTAILTAFDRKWLILAGLLCLGYVWVSVRDSARKKYLALPLALACGAVMLLLSFGLYPLLAKPLIDVRSMYGFGAFLAFLAVPAAGAKKAVPAKLVCFALSWCFFVFAFTYGNALYVQKTYTEFRIDEVIDSLMDMEPDVTSSGRSLLQIRGDIGYAPALQRSMERFPMLGELVPPTFAGWDWTSFGFLHYYGLPGLADMTLLQDDGSIDLRPSLTLLEETVYHAIYGNNAILLIDLK